MIAMAILATVIVVLLENHGASLQMSERSRRVSIAINLAKSVMNDLELQGFPDITSDQGDFSDTYPGLYPEYRWERDVQENVFWNYVRECRVRVFWPDGPTEQMVEIMQYLAATTKEMQQAADLTDDDSSKSDDDAAGGSSSGSSSGSSGGSTTSKTTTGGH